MRYIVLQNTNRRGASWLISQEHLTIGRSEECNIRVVDPAISRRHCKVWLEKEDVLFEDLGSANSCLVNGEPLHSGHLPVGAILSVGPAQFVISSTVSEDPAPPSTCDETPITIAVQRGIYAEGVSSERLTLATPRTIHELYDLFNLARELGAAQRIHELAELLGNALKKHFQPQAFWLAWRHGAGEHLFWQIVEELPTADAPPSELLQKALSERQAIISPGVHRDNGTRTVETLMAVPLIHADEVLGGFVLRGRRPSPLYAEEDLQYALGVASIVAPHVRAIQHAEQLRRDHAALQQRTGPGNKILGRSKVISDLRERLTMAARGHINVLLLGETGTGKELAARLIHEKSPRANGPYVVINCAAIPRELFESELFGHERGSFTGATQQRIGRFEEAHGGTLFLDEVGDLSPDNQARILRALDSGSFHRVGGTRLIQADVRIVAATNKPLAEPAFRSDLFHRLNGIRIDIPPLRAHPTDIPELARHFLQAAAPRLPFHVIDIAQDALALLQNYSWPGNVRELKLAIEGAALTARTGVLQTDDFSHRIPTPDTNAHVGSGDSQENAPLKSLAEVERQHILRVLAACNQNVSAAARILGITRVTLYKKVATELGMNDPT